MNGFEHANGGLYEPFEGPSLMDFMNTATWDRLLRITVGLAMLWLGWHQAEGFVSSALRVFALYPLISGLAGWCPIYALLNVRSRRR